MKKTVAKDTLGQSRQRAVLIVLCAGALMVSYVETMIIPGISAFETFFKSQLSLVSWILTAYLVIGSAFVPIAGKLGDIYGKKKILIVILSVYFIAVTLAGFSPNLGDRFGMTRPNELYLLIMVRAIQGAGMGIFPLSFALIGEEFPKKEIANAQGIVSAMFAVGASIGLIGGAWTTQNYGWQMTYHTIIPISLIVLVLSVLMLHESRVRKSTSMDLPGAVLLATMLVFFLTGLTEGPTWGWGDVSAYHLGAIPFGVPVLLVISLVLLIVFVLWERRTKAPIVDFQKLSERNILVANLVGFFAGTAMFLMYVGAVARVEYPKEIGGFGLTVLDLGIYSLPATFVAMVSAPLIGKAISRYGPKPAMMGGTLLFALGGLGLIFYDTTIAGLVIGIIPILTGIIAVFISATNATVLSARPGEAGIQQGMRQTFQNLGNSIGPIMSSTILASLVTTYTFHVHGFPVSMKGPSAGAYQAIFGMVALMGIIAFCITLAFENFKVEDKDKERKRTTRTRHKDEDE